MPEQDKDSPEYLAKRDFYRSLLTVFGRKAVREALANESLHCHALHLADSNRGGGIVEEIRSLATARGIEIRQHSRAELSRISKNGKQDQGVALDIRCPNFMGLAAHLKQLNAAKPLRMLALDGIHNPQNLGMIVRSAVAGGIDAILWSKRGNAAPGPLVIKASVGTLYTAPVVHCNDLAEALRSYRELGVKVCSLSAEAEHSLFDWRPDGSAIYVLGNETEGVSTAVSKLADQALSIPMAGGVESLNVAVAASLIAFAPGLAASAHLDR